MLSIIIEIGIDKLILLNFEPTQPLTEGSKFRFRLRHYWVCFPRRGMLGEVVTL